MVIGIFIYFSVIYKFMTYQDESFKSGCCWYDYKDTISLSGCRTDIIFGYSGIGSPHGHAVFFNNYQIYQRQEGSLRAELSGSQIVIQTQI
jgi:hypothetical protein